MAPISPGPRSASPSPALQRLVALLRGDDIDAALDAGLMEIAADALHALDTESRQLVLANRQRLRAAWAARERYGARADRLARRAAEREARRSPPTQGPSGAPAGPSLPAAAAAALTRAKARAGGA
ncbi:hypothetical protein [Luteimonas kalidii]|uniref:Uncharacterized protein n=1 Tax=Luteimonas kalidii TaxID=3042025 RepID=A0ABT6JP88_9GAMM|nr:hypothetical protein [Luteimonas kalidii]MDH5832457.1 hypothetical protein [Luteimonas kalidii]